MFFIALLITATVTGILAVVHGCYQGKGGWDLAREVGGQIINWGLTICSGALLQVLLIWLNPRRS